VRSRGSAKRSTHPATVLCAERHHARRLSLSSCSVRHLVSFLSFSHLAGIYRFRLTSQYSDQSSRAPSGASCKAGFESSFPKPFFAVTASQDATPVRSISGFARISHDASAMFEYTERSPAQLHLGFHGIGDHYLDSLNSDTCKCKISTYQSDCN